MSLNISMETMDIDPMIYNSIVQWYSDPLNMSKFVDIMQNKNISLRIYNWFVTNYAKSHDCKFKHTKNGVTRLVIVYHEYLANCKAYHKEWFDPICRSKNKVNCITIDTVYNNKNITIKTSAAQLCFFRWIIDNGIDQYIKFHIEEIKADIFEYIDKVKNGKIVPKRGRSSASEDSYNCIQSIDMKSLEEFTDNGLESISESI